MLKNKKNILSTSKSTIQKSKNIKTKSFNLLFNGTAKIQNFNLKKSRKQQIYAVIIILMLTIGGFRFINI